MANNGKIALALLLGAAAGAAMGLLFAPGTGDETRNKLSEGMKDLGKKLTQKGEGLSDPDEMYDAVKSQIKSTATRNV
jgi:gas vesicle protein